ncbi:MAG: CHASE2 domain-containing protein [Myxococcota bacterium]
MSKRARTEPNWLAALPTCVAVAIAGMAQLAGAGDVLDRRLHDTFIRIAPENGPAPTRALPDVTVVTIDPRSLRASDPWPWSRRVHADAVERLTEAGAAAIAFDIDFSSATDPEADARFAEALHASGRSVLATFSQTQRLAGGAELEIVNRPIPSLERAATGLGSVLVPIDSDGVVRHAPRASAIGGEPIPSLARAALAVATPEHLRARVAAANDRHTGTLLDFRRAFPPIPRVAYVDLMEGRFDRDAIEGRAVFVGATAAEFQDLWATPVEPALPGVLIQAIGYRTAAAEAMDAAVLTPAPTAAVLALFATLALLTRPRPGWNAGARGLLFLGLGTGLVLAAWAGVWFAAFAVPISLALGLLITQYALGIETLQRRIRARAEAQASSLEALARLGDVPANVSAGPATRPTPTTGLELALELLGDVVGARGVVLIRANARGALGRDRIEWRPTVASDDALAVDEVLAARALEDGETQEIDDPAATGARQVYAPLVAGQEPVGVLVVFCREGAGVDSIQRRTIATVGAQLALTAQNLRLIDRLRETFESSIAAVASAVEARDGYTDQHCRRLAAFSSLMGARLGMGEEELRAMELGALLHDVGKIGIPDAVLNKPGRLSNEERREMERHPEIGAGIVAPVVGLEETTLHCVIYHHERWDGSGYPEGLAGEEIPLAARIVSIVDVWDALSTKRPYKKAFTQAEVRDLLVKGRGTQFDPALVDLFFEVLEDQGEEMLELIARSSGQGLPD